MVRVLTIENSAAASVDIHISYIICSFLFIVTKMSDTNQEIPKSDEVNKELSKTFDVLVQNAYKSIVKCTKTAQSFPSTHENSLLIASPNYISGVAGTSDKVMTLVDSLLKTQNISKSMSKLYLEGQKDILTEANDKLLESINTRIDVMAGTKTPSVLPSQPKIVKESWNKNAKASNVWQEVHDNKKKSANWFMLNKGAVEIERPQLQFKVKVDNSYEQLFEPKLKEKPNALKPLAILLEKYDAIESFCHPYEYELDLYVPKEDFLKCEEPKQALPLSDTPLMMITEPEQVTQLVSELKQQQEIAIDLEYHNYRSYQGYTCLMQISTRDKDYIVDTLKLREDLEVLNEVLTDKNIVKVFHGADSDIKWLQKDFGLYVVGMFDTHQACKFLPMPRQSLAYLLKHYCDVDSDKTFQLFDWRHRPLPEPAIQYARTDTHYLLYVYDCMKLDLSAAAHGKQNLVLSTFTNSRNICKLKYEKPVFNEEGYMNIFRSHALLNNQQKYALRELYKWRDRIARDKDESTGYVLPNHMLLQMAQSIPRDIQGIFACCNPVPQTVKEHVLDIHAIILKARLQPLTKPVEKLQPSLDGMKKKQQQQVSPPHDSMDCLNYKGLPPVFPNNIICAPSNTHLSSYDPQDKKIAQIGLFFEDKMKIGSNKYQKIKLKTSRFETPYQRFLKSKEYAKAIQEKVDKENAEQKKIDALTPQVKTEPEENVKIKQEPVVLKQIKSEEKVEMEKEKRKKILREREEEKEEQPATKKIKVEKPEESNEKTKQHKIKSEPKENDSSKGKSGGTISTVDFSKVNYNKYMAKPGKSNQKKKGKGGKQNKKKKNR